MHWIRFTIFLLSLALTSCVHESTDVELNDAPPVALVQENCQKAQSIIRGKLTAVQDAQNAYSSALLTVEQVYKGPFQAADTVRYYSFRSEKYDPSRLGKSYIVFLIARKENGQTRWGTATDLAEFPDNLVTEKLIQKILK